jgi:WD40 repeat protein
MVSAGYDRLVKFWDVRVSGRDSCCLDLVGAGGAVTHVAIDATNPHRIIGVSSENVVRIWDTRLLHYGEPFQTFHVGHTDRICDILQVDGLLITGSRDGSVMSWNINTGQCVQTLRCDSSTVVDGFASAESPHRKMTFSQHASLACTRLLHIPGIHRDDEAGMNRTIDNSALSNHSDSYSTLNSRKEQYTDAMLVTGDYGGTVKVWKGVTRSVCKL